MMRVEAAETEISHRTDRAQFCIRGKIFVPFILVQVVSKTLLRLNWQEVLESHLPNPCWPLLPCLDQRRNRD